MKKTNSKDYHNYIIKDREFIGAFEAMYKNIDDPWHHGNALDIQYDLSLYLIHKHKICKNTPKGENQHG